MNEATNKNSAPSTGGAFADGLTLIRIVLTPIIMFIIYLAWSGQDNDPENYVSLDLSLVLFASILFAVAAVTDLLDDYVGGEAANSSRMFGWLDDIADSILVNGTLLMLLWVTHTAGLLHWTFIVPVALLLARDVIVALFKGYEISKFGFLESRLGDLKSFLAMFAACTLVAAPWLSNLIDEFRASRTTGNIMDIYNSTSPWAWNLGLGLLWISALLALFTGYRILLSKPDQHSKQNTKNEA